MQILFHMHTAQLLTRSEVVSPSEGLFITSVALSVFGRQAHPCRMLSLGFRPGVDLWEAVAGDWNASRRKISISQ